MKKGDILAMRSILVTRPQPAADEFAEKLRREGYTAHVAPMMEYVGIGAEVGDLADYQALIFTSAQAVQVFCDLCSERNIPVLAVGDATAAAAAKMGFVNVRSAKGTSQDVVALIREEASTLNLRKALHLCGADTADDIAAAVEKAGVEVVPRTVYKAVLVNSIPDDVVAALQRGAVDTVMLFSKRTAENFVRLMMARGLRNVCPRLEVICISDTVASALRELPWRSIRVARQPRLEAVMQALHDRDKPQERRQRTERRRKAAVLDERGHVDSGAYAGPERRANSRRRHDATQRKRIWREKKRILNRSMLTGAFMFIAIVLAGVFLMAPEYAHIEEKHIAVEQPEGGKSAESRAPGALLNRFILWFQRTANPVADAVSGAASSAADMAVNPGSADFVQVLSNVTAARQQGGGNEAVAQALDHLRSLLSSPDVRTPEDVNRVVDKARDDNKTLDGLFGSVKGNDVGAAAMLLALNEFRSNVGGNRPYAEDLALLKKLSGNDPRMNRALQRLAPYAESGVMNRQALQAELKGLAGDIISARLQGQDVSVQTAANKRLARLERAGKAGSAQGAVSSDAIVARAQQLLDKGDVKGAMRELGKLEGASAEAARPWMNNATNHVITDQSSEELMQGALQAMGAGGASLDDIVDMIKQTLEGTSVPYISPSLMKRNGGGNDGIVAPAATAIPSP